MTTPSRTLPSAEPVTGDSQAPASSYAIERVAPRTPGSLVPSIEKVRLLPIGVEASVVNISVRGVLISSPKKLGAGMAVRVVFEGAGAPPPASGKVARSLVSRIGQGGEVWYDVGIAFDHPIAFESAATTTTSEAGDAPVESSPTVRQFVNRW